eukprot:2769543-Amphidinium_carterae.1
MLQVTLALPGLVEVYGINVNLVLEVLMEVDVEIVAVVLELIDDKEDVELVLTCCPEGEQS